MTRKPYDYTPRKTVNDASRNTADKDRELWSDHEVEILVNFWGEAAVEDIALTLGRTVEACRQKHWELTKKIERKAVQEKVARLTPWDKGFTSLDDMGY